MNWAIAMVSKTIPATSPAVSRENRHQRCSIYFPDDFLLFIDESHITIPQLGGMYRGDRSRKQTLVEFGFRLPSALDNRPLQFEEATARFKRAVYVSATPAAYEGRMAGPNLAEMIVRPTGLEDPVIEVRPAGVQVDDLMEEIKQRADRDERVLVTTLTKRMAEDLTAYYGDLGMLGALSARGYLYTRTHGHYP